MLSSEITGELIGYRFYASKNETGAVVENHVYLCLVKQKLDPITKIPTECAVCEVRENDEVLGNDLKVGTKVTFWQEERRSKNGSFCVYTNIAKKA